MADEQQDAPKYRLAADTTFRAPEQLSDAADEHGFIRAGQTFLLDTSKKGGRSLHHRLTTNRLALPPQASVVPRGGGWYDVVDGEGHVLNTDGAIQGRQAAEDFAEDNETG